LGRASRMGGGLGVVKRVGYIPDPETGVSFFFGFFFLLGGGSELIGFFFNLGCFSPAGGQCLSSQEI
jgi:hypothetical protein